MTEDATLQGLLGSPAEHADAWRASSPLHRVNEPLTDVPRLMFVTKDDSPGHAAQSTMQPRLTEQNIAFETKPAPSTSRDALELIVNWHADLLAPPPPPP